MATDYRNKTNLPLGLRNNNPGNIRPGDNWRGMIGTNHGFVVFSDISWGIRAMATDIIGDIVIDGKNTIRKLITEYAPPSENDTESYINNVVHYTGWSDNATIEATQSNMLKLLRSIMNVELGKSFADLISDSDINDGLSRISTSLKNRIENFFVSNPAISAVAGFSIFAAIVILSIIFFQKQIKNIIS